MTTPPSERNVTSTSSKKDIKQHKQANKGKKESSSILPTVYKVMKAGEHRMEGNKLLKDRIRELEDETSSLKSKIRGYQTLGQMYVDKKQKLETMEKYLLELRKKAPLSFPDDTMEIEEEEEVIEGAVALPLTASINAQENTSFISDKGDKAVSSSHSGETKMMMVTEETLSQTPGDEQAAAAAVPVSLEEQRMMHTSMKRSRSSNPNHKEINLISFPNSHTSEGPSTSMCLNNEPPEFLTPDDKPDADTEGDNVISSVDSHSEELSEIYQKGHGHKHMRIDRTVSTPNLGSHLTCESSFVHIDTSDEGSSSGSSSTSPSCRLRNVSDLFVKYLGNSPPPDAVLDLMNICQHVNKMEKHLQSHKNAVEGLIEEKEEKDLKIKKLQEEVQDLNMRLQTTMKAESERAKTISPVNEQEWIRVDQHEQLESSDEEVDRLGAKVTKMQTFIKSLAEKNRQLIDRMTDERREWESERQDLMDQVTSMEQQVHMQQYPGTQDTHRTQSLKKLQEELKREKQEKHQLQRQLSEMRAEQETSLPVRSSSVTSLRLGWAGAMATSLDSISVMSQGELRELVRVLRQQVLIYKEDFDGERKDREKCQTEKVDLEKRLKRVKGELSHTVNQKVQRELEVVKLREHNYTLRDELTKMRDENRRLKDTLRKMYHQSTSAASSQSTVTHPVERLWPCFKCTYENPQERAICEICGTPRRELYVSQGRLTNTPRFHHHGSPYDVEQCDDKEENYPQYTTTSKYKYDDVVVDQPPKQSLKQRNYRGQ